MQLWRQELPQVDVLMALGVRHALSDGLEKCASYVLSYEKSYTLPK